MVRLRLSRNAIQSREDVSVPVASHTRFLAHTASEKPQARIRRLTRTLTSTITCSSNRHSRERPVESAQNWSWRSRP